LHGLRRFSRPTRRAIRSKPAACNTTNKTPGGLLGADFRSASGLPVVNLAGCPTHPGWVVDTLEKLALEGLAVSDLDELGRPLLLRRPAWCITAAPATSITNSKPVPRSTPISAA
jgi:hypothetical protein